MKINWKKIILIVVILFFLIYLIFYTKIINIAWIFSNKNSGGIQALSTIILTIITGFYAIFTFRMEKVANKQITSDINITNKILKSRLKNKDFEINHLGDNSYFHFYLDFDVFNKSSGAGAIEKPILVLKIDDKKWKINPKRKEYTGSESRNLGSLTSTTDFYKDLGGTIYLKGGDFEKIQLEYGFSCVSDFVDSFKKNQNIEYLIEYKNNLEEVKLVKINDNNVISD